MESNVLTPDLFPEETAKAKAEREAKAAKKKPRGLYHDKRGKFTDKATAEKHFLEKENARLANSYNYYKRVNKRLSGEVKEANERASEWEHKYKAICHEER